MEQAILRSKIRIASNREKPIDFIAKVILIIEGKMPIPSDFLSNEDYKHPFKILAMVNSSQELRDIAVEMETFLNVNKRNKRFQNYWQSQMVLCQLMIDKKSKIE